MELTTNTKVWKLVGMITIAITLVLLALFYFTTIFLTFVVGAIFILLTQKSLRDFNKRAKKNGWSKTKRRWYGYTLVVLWVVVILFFFWQSINDISEVIVTSERSVGGIYQDTIKPLLPEFTQQFITTTMLNDVQAYVISLLSTFFANLSSFIAAAILIIPLMFYMYFKRGPEIAHSLFTALPKKYRKGASRAVEKMGREMNDFFTAKIIESVVVGAIACLGFYIVGLQGWLLLGFIVGFLNIVPYIGPLVGVIPALVVGVIQDPVVGLYVLLVVVIAQLVDNLYLIPFMISSKVRMDPLLSIVLILVGAQLYGATGMIFAIPVYLVYKIILQESYKELVKIYC